MNQIVRRLGDASFTDMCGVLNEVIEAQASLLASLARTAAHSDEPPALDLDALQERVGTLAQLARLVAELVPDEGEVRRLAARRREWQRLLGLHAAQYDGGVPCAALEGDVIREVMPGSEFAAIALSLRDAARALRNDLVPLRAGIPVASAGAPKAFALLVQRAGRVARAAEIFAELAPKECEVRALAPGLAFPAPSQPKQEL